MRANHWSRRITLFGNSLFYRGKRINTKTIMRNYIMMLLIAISVVLYLLIVIYSHDVNTLKSENNNLIKENLKLSSTIEELNTELDTIESTKNNEIDTINTSYKNLENRYNIIYQEVCEDYDIKQSMDVLTTKYNALYNEYKDFQETVNFSKKKLYDISQKYMYIISEIPSDSELTLENLVLIDDLAKKYDINPHLVTSLFWTESRYRTGVKNSQSSAVGIGQFLESTATYVYSEILDYDDDYDHYIDARNPKINIEMTFGYLNYLMETYNLSLKGALYNYSGGDHAYPNIIINHAKHKLNTNNISYNYN